MTSDGSTPATVSPASRVEGVHRNTVQWAAGWTGVIVLLAAAVALWVSGVARDVAALILAEATLVLGAAFVWAWYCRPRLVVTSTHITVVDAVRARRFAWGEIGAFEVQGMLFVIPVTGDPVPVAGLWAGGFRRVIFGVPAEVDRLARDLNAHLAASTERR